MEDLIGQTLEKYTFKKVIGEGGMAIVYLAHDNKFNTDVAIKVLKLEFANNQNIRKRFLAEAKSMYKMSHSNIVKVTDLIDAGDIVAFVMEFIPGDTINDYVKSNKLDTKEIKKIFLEMLDSVEYAHQAGYIHRDIKPSNFMIAKSGKVSLLDFGIAKNTDLESDEYTHTRHTQQMGTPSYMSPEQIEATKPVTYATDIYSLGVVLYFLVQGKGPYSTTGNSLYELQSKIINEPIPLTHTEFDPIISKATSKNENNRFKTIDEFRKDIKIDEEIKPKKYRLMAGVLFLLISIFIIFFLFNKKPEVEFIRIGQQEWTSKNLDVATFRNDDSIPEAKTREAWVKAGEDGKPAWCYHDNDPENGDKYGKLYNWYAVNDPRGLAPRGSHIPSDAEWTKLTDYLGREAAAGNKMKSKDGWQNNGNGNNKSGFSGLPGGIRTTNGAFKNIGANGNWWSSTQDGTNDVWFRYLDYDNGNVVRNNDINKGNGFSVRCIRDLTIEYIIIGNLEVMTKDLGQLNWKEANEACKVLGDRWRLPTKNELNILHENRIEIGGFESRGYWSSTEGSNDGVCGQSFLDGNHVIYYEDYSVFVRAVRVSNPQNRLKIGDKNGPTKILIPVIKIEPESIPIENHLVVMTEDLGEMNWVTAKKACEALGNGWRLPTKNELNILYQNRNKIGGFRDSYYWSSSAGSNDDAWYQSFYRGNTYNYSKDSTYRVRAVRSF